MKFKLKAYNIYEFGQRKDAEGNPHQEDWTFPSRENLNGNDRLFILCDGMGGHDAGEVASATVCEAMSKSIFDAVPDPESNFSKNNLADAITSAYAELDKKDTGAAKKMGTTMTFLKLHENGCMIAHIGDSRVYHIRPGKNADDTKILFVTRDHSLVNDLIKLGEITEEEAKTSKQKNVITRAMQPNQEYRSKADVHESDDIMPGDYFYMCTDGMLENMEDKQLCYYFSEEAGNDDDKVKKLIKATQENKDNHTAFIIHITDVIGTGEKLVTSNQSHLYAEIGNNVSATGENGTFGQPKAETPVANVTPETPPHRDVHSDYNRNVNAQSGRQTSKESSSEKDGKSNNNLLKIIIIAVICLFIGSATYYFLNKDSGKEKSENTAVNKVNDNANTNSNSGPAKQIVKRESLSRNFIKIKNNDGKWAIVRKGSEEKPYFIYDEIEKIGLINHVLIKKGDKEGLVYIGEKKEIIVKPKYDDIDEFSDNLAKVEINKKFGFIDINGKEVIPIEYDDAKDFAEGMAAVCKDNKWGFINKAGSPVINLEYDDAESFENGKSKVKKEGEEFRINKEGKKIESENNPDHETVAEKGGEKPDKGTKPESQTKSKTPDTKTENSQKK